MAASSASSPASSPAASTRSTAHGATASALRHATFRQLSALQTVARMGSVSRAAEELHLTQPAVSLQIAALEEGAGVPLLQRTGRGIRLTEAGELLADYAGRVLALWREAGEQMEAHRGVLGGTLRVAAVTTAEYLMPAMLVAFAAEHPQVALKLQVGNRDQIVRMLAGHEVDLAVMGRPPAELKTEARTFARHPMAFLAAPSHPLMSRRRVDLAQLAGTSLLVRERGSGTRATVERRFKEAGVGLRIGAELSSNEAIKHMCAAGLGVAFLSLHTCVLELEAGLLALLPMAGNPIERDWYVMHLAAQRLPRVAQAFLDFLCERGQAEIDARLGQRLAARAPGPARGRRRA
jgi:DNA-binding transcriptional LysR family regulator